MATPSSVLAWRIPGTVEPGGLPSMGSRKSRTRLKRLSSSSSSSLKLWELPGNLEVSFTSQCQLHLKLCYYLQEHDLLELTGCFHTSYPSWNSPILKVKKTRLRGKEASCKTELELAQA